MPGADPTLPDAWGRTPLMLATTLSNTAAARSLAASGAPCHPAADEAAAEEEEEEGAAEVASAGYPRIVARRGHPAHDASEGVAEYWATVHSKQPAGQTRARLLELVYADRRRRAMAY